MATEFQAAVLTHSADSDAAQLFEAWRAPLIRYLVSCGTNRDEALDIVQDSFLRLHQHLFSGGGRENLRAWVFRVAHNAALNRRMSAERRLASGELSAARDRAVSDDPERALLKKERLRRLHDAMKDLSAAERACVLLRSEGLRYREIAGVLDIGVSTVADCLERALRKLGEKCNV